MAQLLKRSQRTLVAQQMRDAGERQCAPWSSSNGHHGVPSSQIAVQASKTPHPPLCRQTLAHRPRRGLRGRWGLVLSLQDRELRTS